MNKIEEESYLFLELDRILSFNRYDPYDWNWTKVFLSSSYFNHESMENSFKRSNQYQFRSTIDFLNFSISLAVELFQIHGIV